MSYPVSLSLGNVWAKVYEKICRKCGKDFKARVPNAKYCHECRDNATKART